MTNQEIRNKFFNKFSKWFVNQPDIGLWEMYSTLGLPPEVLLDHVARDFEKVKSLILLYYIENSGYFIELSVKEVELVQDYLISSVNKF